ncbi:MAG: hypothetical protein IPO92_08750 [Saprospiraceae bacterium]|nr:hypothetical protein [Saprospiraceae bacterium]
MRLEYERRIHLKNSINKGLAVGMNDIFFRYKDAAFDSVSGLTPLEMFANERICISRIKHFGKIYFVELLTGLYSPDRGSITYDDLPIKEL